jgi:hypothetical protein
MFYNLDKNNMKSNTTTIRYDENLKRTLNDIDEKPTTAAQNALHLFAGLRRGVLQELKGMFTRSEIIAMADSYNGTMPTWNYMSVPNMFEIHMQDAETYEAAISKHGAKPTELLSKVAALSSAQTAVLQLELYIFWNNGHSDSYGSPTPDLEKLIDKLA